ncbi:MAG TPA: type 1 fimbrial protein, partial [Ruminococcaceae bacterium]|nr:type 1 fimbrial protein [Oscillospiraceae bacterium]
NILIKQTVDGEIKPTTRTQRAKLKLKASQQTAWANGPLRAGATGFALLFPAAYQR